MSTHIHRLLLVLAAGATVCCSGCYAFMDDIYETEQCLVNEVHAHSAWYRMDDCYEGVEHQCDFSCGFRDGYRATAERGDHCLPTMPPRKYWKHCYQDCEGRQKIDAWFEGYAHGMLAANQDGVYHYHQIPYYGPQHDMETSGASHVITVEENEEIENVPEPIPANELPIDRTDRPVPTPPVTGHSIPVPAPPKAAPTGPPLLPIPEARFIAPGQQDAQRDCLQTDVFYSKQPRKLVVTAAKSGREW